MEIPEAITYLETEVDGLSRAVPETWSEYAGDVLAAIDVVRGAAHAASETLEDFADYVGDMLEDEPSEEQITRLAQAAKNSLAASLPAILREVGGAR